MATCEKITLSSIALGVMAMLFLFGGVSDADIEKCRESTGWGVERCLQEIVR